MTRRKKGKPVVQRSPEAKARAGHKMRHIIWKSKHGPPGLWMMFATRNDANMIARFQWSHKFLPPLLVEWRGKAFPWNCGPISGATV